MPELPEVETIRREIEPDVIDRMVLEAGSHPSEKFTPARDLVGAELTAATRRGKFLILPTADDRELIIHLGMTGALHFVDPNIEELDPYVRAWWLLGPAVGGSTQETTMLVYRDVRRFGRIRVVPTGEYGGIPTLASMGPEPFDPNFDGEQFWTLLRRSRRRLKTQLLSQRPIAGVGNIYADEALWLARLNPRLTTVSRPRAAVLLDAIRTVLGQGIENGGTTLRDYRNVSGGEGTNQQTLAAYGRGGLACLRCSETLRSAVIDARTSTWCATCQRR